MNAPDRAYLDLKLMNNLVFARDLYDLQKCELKI